jgi:hypothetical protein
LLLLSGCSTVEGQQAQALLVEADVAQAALTSSSFEGGLSFAVAGQEVSLRFAGAASGSDGYLAISSTALPVNMKVIARGGRIWTNADGAWQQLPAGTGQDLTSSPSLTAAAFSELTKHVRDVRVTEGQVVRGRAVSIVAGELDTAGLVGAMSGLSGLGDLGGGFDLDDLRSQLGDVEAVLTIDEGTKLLTAALVTLSIGSGDETVDVRVDYRLTSSNEPVRIPSPGA